MVEIRSQKNWMRGEEKRQKTLKCGEKKKT